MLTTLLIFSYGTAPSRPAPPPASCTCATSTTATRSPSSRGGPRRSRSSATLPSTGVPRPDHRRRRLHLRPTAARPTATPSWSEGSRRRIMDAAECIGCGACVASCPNGAASFSRRQSRPPGCCRRGRWSHRRVAAMVDTMEEPVRQLHQPLRMPGGVPEGDQRQVHRHAEPRLHQGPVQEPQAVGATHLTVRAHQEAKRSETRREGRRRSPDTRPRGARRRRAGSPTGGWSRALHASTSSRKSPRCFVTRNSGPKTAWAAVAPRQHETFGFTTASSCVHHCRHAPISLAFGFWCRRTFPRLPLEVLHRVRHVDVAAVDLGLDEGAV